MRKQGMGNFTAAILGVVAGAAAVFLSDRGNREKLKTKARELMEKSEEKVEETKLKVDEAKEKSRQKLADTLGNASNKLRQGSLKS